MMTAAEQYAHSAPVNRRKVILEAFEAGLEEAAKIAEDHKSWKKLIPPNHGVSNVTVAGLYVAAAIREKIKGAAVGAQEENTQ